MGEKDRKSLFCWCPWIPSVDLLFFAEECSFIIYSKSLGCDSWSAGGSPHIKNPCFRHKSIPSTTEESWYDHRKRLHKTNDLPQIICQFNHLTWHVVLLRCLFCVTYSLEKPRLHWRCDLIVLVPFHKPSKPSVGRQKRSHAPGCLLESNGEN